MICCAFCTFCIYTSAQIIIIIIIGSVRFDFVLAKTCKTLKLGLLAEPKVIYKKKQKKALRVIISLLGCILSHCKLKICVQFENSFLVSHRICTGETLTRIFTVSEVNCDFTVSRSTALLNINMGLLN